MASEQLNHRTLTRAALLEGERDYVYERVRMNESEYGHGLGAPTVILSVLPEARPFCVIPVTQRFVSE